MDLVVQAAQVAMVVKAAMETHLEGVEATDRVVQAAPGVTVVFLAK